MPYCSATIQTLAKRKASEIIDKLTKKPGKGGGRPAKNKNLVRAADEVSAYGEALDEIGVKMIREIKSAART